MYFSFREQKGFTLIELLVVIAIIGILTSVVLASLNNARAKGRDAKRVSDMKQLQLALEFYYDANSNTYPNSLNDLASTYIGTVPVDPGSTSYEYGTDGVTYILGATLEKSNSVFVEDVDTGAFSIDCSDGNMKYCLAP